MGAAILSCPIHLGGDAFSAEQGSPMASRRCSALVVGLDWSFSKELSPPSLGNPIGET
jgi:hypothetical protein